MALRSRMSIDTAAPVPRRYATANMLAGLLTPKPRFPSPSHCSCRQAAHATMAKERGKLRLKFNRRLSYSGGAVPDSHRIPFHQHTVRKLIGVAQNVNDQSTEESPSFSSSSMFAGKPLSHRGEGLDCSVAMVARPWACTFRGTKSPRDQIPAASTSGDNRYGIEILFRHRQESRTHWLGQIKSAALNQCKFASR